LEEIVVRLRLKAEIQAADDERVDEKGEGEDGDEQQFQVNRFVEGDESKPLLFGEGRTVDLARVFDFFVDVDFAIRVLRVQRHQKLLRFRGELLNLNIADLQKDFENLYFFAVDAMDRKEHKQGGPRYEQQPADQH
jgi:hypothetical protein